MNRRNVLTLCVIAASGIVLVPSAAIGQEKSLKEQLVGAWTLVSAVDTLPDGSKSEPWGPNPKGAYMFDANGRFAQMLMRSDLPKLASRLQGTPEQNKAIAQGAIAMYGTYSVNEADKVISVHFEGSTFAGFVGTDGKRIVTSITADELKTMNPATSTGTKAESVWRRVK
jgi:hypothetical protein